MPSKGKEQRGVGGEKVGAPKYPNTTPPPLPSGDYSYTLEIVMQMQNTLGKLTEAVDGLKSKQAEQGSKLDRISHQIYATIVLLVLLGGILGFFAKSINDLIAHAIISSVPK
jgi:hypothetical protein